LLTLILFLPAIAALVLLLIPDRDPQVFRWGALGASLLTFVLALVLWFNFNPTPDAAAPFQFMEQTGWYGAIHASYHVGVDGISLAMLLLTTFISPLAILASFSVKERVKPYMILFLFLETGMLGVFMALDLLLFFVFWEIGLVPDVLLDGAMGRQKPQLCLTQVHPLHDGGSLGLLLAIQLMAWRSGTFDLPELFAQWPQLTALSLPLGVSLETVRRSLSGPS
jgi:NADH-quinone oxidoreductase subunit M